MRFADTAVIVSSVRDSDRVMGLLDPKTEKAEKGRRVEKHILITRYDAQWAVPRRDAQYRRRRLSTPLLGIIPESEAMLCASNIGAPVTLRRGRGRGDGPGNSPRAFQPRWTTLFNMPLRSVREADLHMWIPPTQKDIALGREVALCSRDMPPHPFTPSNKNRRQLFRPALSTLFDLIM